MDRWHTSKQVIRRSLPIWNQPGVLLLILAVCGLGIYWWFGQPEEITWIDKAGALVEGAGDAIEGLQVKAEKWTHDMFRERQSPPPETDVEGQPRHGPGIETVEEELPTQPVVRRLDSKRDAIENQTSGEATEKIPRQSFREKQYPRIVTQLKQIL